MHPLEIRLRKASGTDGELCSTDSQLGHDGSINRGCCLVEVEVRYYAFKIMNIAGDGPVVLTERLGYIQTPDGAKPGVRAMGTFVVGDDGKITRRTDNFDISLTVKLLQGEDISALIPAAPHT